VADGEHVEIRDTPAVVDRGVARDDAVRSTVS
jgi:hypothetical protein